MRILFVPNAGGVISHGVPLLALSKQLPASTFSTAFLVGKESHALFRALGAHVLDLAHDGARTEMIAYHRFKPDVVVDDMSISTAIVSQLSGIPRVTIQRTGEFPGSRRDNTSHSGNLDFELLRNVSALGLVRPTSPADLVQSECVLVPGIPSIERLPAHLQADPRYVYTGPLLIDDRFAQGDALLTTDLSVVVRYLQHHRGGPVVYVTFGNIAQPTRRLLALMRALIERRIAVISNVLLEDVATAERDFYLYARYLPMHLVCSHASLVVHHCGSGTYHYPLMHELPSIAIGTRCYDRDEVALRLHQLGACTYLDFLDESAAIDARFAEMVDTYLNRSSPETQRCLASVRSLRSEIDTVTASFHFDRVLAGVAGTRKARA
ncbi:MAG TPA: hypothetical protein VI485_18740 [Vicinamibacterales bacterium]|nr:hypothetical protein [Vicinamibacterales bacterium]